MCIRDRSEREPLWPLLSPIFAVVVVYAAARSGLSLVWRSLSTDGATAQRYLPMLLGILVAIWLLERRHPLPLREWAKILFAPRTWQLIALVMGVSLFGAVIEEPLPFGSTIAEVMQAEIAAWRLIIGDSEFAVPPLVLAAILPLVAGLSTGITVAYVGASFPVVFGMLGEKPVPAVFYTTLALALPFGYIGMMLSPLHICWAVTNQYFKVSLFASFRGIALPALAVLFAAIAASMAISWCLVPP